jgi:hypothetical protein
LDSTQTVTFSYNDSIDFASGAVAAGFTEGNYVAYTYYQCDSGNTPGATDIPHFLVVKN